MNVQYLNDQTLLRAFMNGDPAETAYALGDLDPANRALSDFYGAWQDDELQGLVLLYHGFAVPTLTMHGDPIAIRTILSQIDLPREVFCLAPENFKAAIGVHYDMQYIYPLWRMVVTPDSFRDVGVALDRDQRLVRLQSADADRLNHFYQQAADPDEEVLAFSPSQIENGVFYAIEQHGRLLAAAGTHIASVAESVAGVGNVFTAPDQRGQGFGQLTTAAVTRQLFAMGIEHVVLNVKAHNAPAIHVYEKLGYNFHCMMLEGPAPLRT